VLIGIQILLGYLAYRISTVSIYLFLTILVTSYIKSNHWNIWGCFTEKRGGLSPSLNLVELEV